MPLALYIAGFAVMVAGLAYGAHLAGVPDRWITVGIIILAGIGILSAASKVRGPAD